MTAGKTTAATTAARCHVCRRTEVEGATFACDRSKRGGTANKCRDCNADKCRRWYEVNRERKRRSVRDWKQARRAQWEARKWEMCRAIVDALSKTQRA